MPNTSVLTAPTYGPGLNPASLSFTNVKSVEFDFERSVVKIVHGIPPRISYFDNLTMGGVTYTRDGDNLTAEVAINWS